MKFTQAVKMSLSAIFSNKMRSILTMLGIIIGVIAVSMLVSIVQGVAGQVNDQFDSLGGNVLTAMISSPKKNYITLDELHDLEGQDGLRYVSPSVSKSSTAKANNQSLDVTVEGVTDKYINIRSLDLVSGRFLSESDIDNRTAVAVVGHKVADELFGSQDIIGETIRAEGRDFKIVGVLKEDTTMIMSNNDRIMIPFTTATRLLKQTNISTIYASSESEETNDSAQNKLEDFLKFKIKNEDDYMVFNQGDILEAMDEVMNYFSMMLAGIASISLLVGGIGIMNIMLVSVTERTKEIGIRKAIGAQRSDIIIQFMIEAVTISLVGGMIGLLIGMFGVFLVSILTGITMGVALEIALLAIIFSVVVGIIFGIYPANKASKLRPIDALRFE